jgi:hypothetical protein
MAGNFSARGGPPSDWTAVCSGKALYNHCCEFLHSDRYEYSLDDLGF